MRTKSAAVWILMCGAALGVGAIAEYVVQTPKLRREEPVENQAPILPPLKNRDAEAGNPNKVQASVVVYVPTMGTDGISFTKQSAPVPDGADAKVVAINEFLKAAQIAPADTQAMSISVQDGSAKVAFNAAFKQTYGTFDEKKMIDGLRAAMGQFPDVDQFTLWVGDEQLKTLGSADLTNPISVTRPDAVPMHTVPSTPKPDTVATKP